MVPPYQKDSAIYNFEIPTLYPMARPLKTPIFNKWDLRAAKPLDKFDYALDEVQTPPEARLT